MAKWLRRGAILVATLLVTVSVPLAGTIIAFIVIGLGEKYYQRECWWLD